MWLNAIDLKRGTDELPHVALRCAPGTLEARNAIHTDTEATKAMTALSGAGHLHFVQNTIRSPMARDICTKLGALFYFGLTPLGVLSTAVSTTFRTPDMA